MRKIISASTTLVLCCLLSACLPYSPPKLLEANGQGTSFDGIKTLVRSNSNKENQIVDVVLVHGMCTHDEVWAKEAITELFIALNKYEPKAQTSQPAPMRKIVAGSKALIFSDSHRYSFGTVRASAIVWSPIVADTKRNLCYDTSVKDSTHPCGKTEYPHDRASLNASLKNGLINDCFADAMIYQGASRDEIRKQLQQAIISALTPSLDQNTLDKATQQRALEAETSTIVFMTESLGSKMTFDAITKLMKEDGSQQIALNIRRRSQMIFMGANQMPLLTLAEQTIGPHSTQPDGGQKLHLPPAEANNSLLDFINMEQHSITEKMPPVLAGKLTVVAFSDPNDLLSYPLKDAYTTDASFIGIDVIVSNARTWFGLLENPDKAHRHYWSNKDVTKLLACGSTNGC